MPGRAHHLSLSQNGYPVSSFKAPSIITTPPAHETKSEAEAGKTVRFFYPSDPQRGTLASCTTSVYVRLSKNTHPVCPHAFQRESGCKGTHFSRTAKTFRTFFSGKRNFFRFHDKNGRKEQGDTLLYYRETGDRRKEKGERRREEGGGKEKRRKHFLNRVSKKQQEGAIKRNKGRFYKKT